ncbi:MAG TPA: flagellar biosynthetic protein FliR [Candidatus Limnocylindrales bacterium]
MTFNLTALFDAWTYQFLLVFARVGGAIMLIPGLGDFRVPARVRLLFALILSALVVGNVADVLPATPPQFGQMAWQVVSEAGIGLFIGLTAALLMSILHMAGAVIAAQVGLGNALTGELFSADQGVSLGAGLMAAGLVIIFATGLDHLMLTAIARSYEGLPAARLAMLGDVADTLTTTMSAAFSVAIQLSTPFLVLGLAFNLGLALANRALPQLPVFFVGLPASLAGGLIVLMIAVPAILIGFAEAFETLFVSALP